MSDSGTPPSFPPPGAVPPPGPPGPPPPGWSAPPPYAAPPPPPPPPGWGAPAGYAPPGYAPVPGPAPWLRGAAHKPGAFPLRPLGLTDIYDAAFKIIRFNPKATVGAALGVAAVSMALPIVVTALLTATSNLAIDAGGDTLGGPDVAAVVGTAGSFGIGLLLQWVGTLLVTGLIVHVAMAAAIGQRLSLGEAWARTHGRRWRLLLLALVTMLVYLAPLALYALLWVLIVLVDSTALTIVWAVVTIPAFLCLMVWIWARFVYLSVPALVVERVGVLASLSRAWTLTRKQFWRTFGIALLTLIVTGVAAQVLTTPISFVLSLALTGLGPEYFVLGLVVTQAVTTVISAAFVTPFTAAVTSLQYVDQRMRKEAYDVELMQQAGVTAA